MALTFDKGRHGPGVGHYRSLTIKLGVWPYGFERQNRGAGRAGQIRRPSFQSTLPLFHELVALINSGSAFQSLGPVRKQLIDSDGIESHRGQFRDTGSAEIMKAPGRKG